MPDITTAIPGSAIAFLREKKHRLDDAFARLEEGEIDHAKLLRAGLTRRELERLGNYEDAGVLSDILNGQWSLCYDLMRACFDPAQVEKLFLDTLK